ncbi:hypothetical protein CA85_33310 [Allorhodopirellula solitaria]|uniref:Uncharacterized protein n=1 Tax=Allorhodopirellula solitaria TaxID=2527987 RepID=A0A5C5XP49_9BACT|nr:hypothetical protein CA85_33310 [Allorhodopirellula solitaria]
MISDDGFAQADRIPTLSRRLAITEYVTWHSICTAKAFAPANGDPIQYEREPR